MKFSALLVATVCAFSTLSLDAFACRNLGSIMDDMDTNFKYVARNYKVPASRAQVLTSANALLTYAQEAAGCPPHAVSARPEALTQWNGLFSQLVTATQNFGVSLQSDDLVNAETYFREMDTIRRQGHHIFD